MVSTIDTHSNMDCLSAIRDPSRLCMDLIENPAGVLLALEQVDELVQCDFPYMVSPERMSS